MKPILHLPMLPVRKASAAFILLSATSAGLAVDYSGSVIIDANSAYNDNLRMAEDDKTSVVQYTAAPILTFAAETERTQLSLSSTLTFNRFDKNQFNSDDQNLVLSLKHDLEYHTFGLTAAVIRDSTITSELLGSGRIDDSAERTETYQASPSWTYSINESNQLLLNGNYNVRNYDSGSYIGYKEASAHLDWVHILSERIKLILAGTYKDYKSDDRGILVPGQILEVSTIFGTQNLPPGFFGLQTFNTRSKDRGAMIGFDYLWGEQSQIQLRAGKTKNRQTFPAKQGEEICSDDLYQQLHDLDYDVGGVCDLDQESTLTTLQLTWDWKGEQNHVSVNSTKSTQPSSNGYSVDSIQLGANWRYDITELDSFTANLSAVRNRAISSDAVLQNDAAADRDYQSWTLTYRRQLNDQWFVNGSFQYNNQKYQDVDYQANSKVFTIGIRYQPQEKHWSR